MSDLLINTTYLYVSSVNASGDFNENVTIDIPSNVMVCNKRTQYIKMTMCQHSFISEIYNIAPPYNVLVINGTNYTLNPGNYRTIDLIAEIASLNVNLTISYNALQNTFTFANTSNASITFQAPDRLSYLFGLRPNNDTIIVPVLGISSPYQVVPRYINDLIIHVGGVAVGPPINVTNVGQGETRINTSNILGIVPIHAAPGLLNVTENTSGMYEVQIMDDDINRITFLTTDIDGIPIPNMPPWTAVFRIDIYQKPQQDPVVQKLQEIVNYLRMFFLKTAVDSNVLDEVEANVMTT